MITSLIITGTRINNIKKAGPGESALVDASSGLVGHYSPTIGAGEDTLCFTLVRYSDGASKAAVFLPALRTGDFGALMHAKIGKLAAPFFDIRGHGLFLQHHRELNNLPGTKLTVNPANRKKRRVFGPHLAPLPGLLCDPLIPLSLRGKAVQVAGGR